jgi:hypothetical protein
MKTIIDNVKKELKPLWVIALFYLFYTASTFNFLLQVFSSE